MPFEDDAGWPIGARDTKRRCIATRTRRLRPR